MEKTLSPEDRIRRAEEIYQRRKNELGKNYARVNVENNKKDFTIFKKIFFQLLICIVIYAIFYLINTTNYVFSDNVLNKTKEILSYDINIQNLYSRGKKYINMFIKKEVNEKDESAESKEEINNEVNAEEIHEEVPLTQMELDVKDILNSTSFIIPLNGEITSRFGLRESTDPRVTKNHTGIDIARAEGTVFVAAMDGTVEEVSSEGDLGNHIRIKNSDVETVYAHCREIYVKEGEIIVQGQNLGEVGQTRECNRPTSSF